MIYLLVIVWHVLQRQLNSVGAHWSVALMPLEVSSNKVLVWTADDSHVLPSQSVFLYDIVKNVEEFAQFDV